MLSKTLEDTLNEQITHEFYSSQLYLAMSAYLESRNLPGFAAAMRRQSREESEHALKFLDMILDRGGRVALAQIDAPPSEFESPLDVAQQALEHEQKVTGLINQIYALAVREGDFTTQAQIQWFITEQVEEEKSATDLVEQVRMTGSTGPALFLLDRDLAGRAAQPESAAS